MRRKIVLLGMMMLVVLGVALTKPPQTLCNCYRGLCGDANHDGWVNALDFSILNSAWHTEQGDKGFDARADFNCDRRVDEADFAILETWYWKRVR